MRPRDLPQKIFGGMMAQVVKVFNNVLASSPSIDARSRHGLRNSMFNSRPKYRYTSGPVLYHSNTTIKGTEKSAVASKRAHLLDYSTSFKPYNGRNKQSRRLAGEM